MTDSNKTGCKVTGCDSPVYAKGYCNKHYNQMRIHGSLTPEIERITYTDETSTCIEEGCQSKVVAKRLCMTHYQHHRRMREDSTQVSPPPTHRRTRTRRRRA